MPDHAATHDQRRADLGRAARDPRQIDLGPHARGRPNGFDRSAPRTPQAPLDGNGADPDGQPHPAGNGSAGARAKGGGESGKQDDDKRDGDDKKDDDEKSGDKESGNKESGNKKGDDKKGDDEDGDDKKDGDEPKKPSPLSKTWVRVLIAVIVVLALLAGGLWLYRYWTHGRFVESTNNAYLQADQVTVSSKVSGTVEEVFVDDNQQVHAGDRLVRIDDSSNRARVEQALAQAAQGRAAILQYEAQIAEQEATIAQSFAAVQGAQSQRRFSQSEVDRYEPLARSGSETVEKLAQMVANRDQASAMLRQNQAQNLQARRRIATLRTQIGMSQAQVAQAEALARQARIDVESALIRASVDGRVGDRQVRVGQEAQVGTRMMTLVPVQAIYLVANFKETQIGLMRVGQPATIKVDALDGMALEGTVESFSPATGASFALIPANNATGNFTKIVQRVPVRIRIEAGEEARKVLVPGLSVEVSVDTVGRKRFVEERKDEEKRGKDERKDETRDSVDRDRRNPASGAGR